MTRENPVLNMLRAHSFTLGLDETYLKMLVPLAEVRAYNAGERIITAGEPAQACFLVRDGRVSVEVRQENGNVTVLQYLTGSHVLGWSWLVEPHRWCFDATAQALTRVIVLDAAALREQMAADHEFGYWMYRRFTEVCAERLQATRVQLLEALPSPA